MRRVFPFTPTSASWLNAVEGFFSAITRRRIRCGVFRTAAELEDAIRRYIRDHSGHAQPFVWTKTAKEICDKIDRLPAPVDSEDALSANVDTLAGLHVRMSRRVQSTVPSGPAIANSNRRF